MISSGVSPVWAAKAPTRMAYEVMAMSNEQAMELAKAIEHAKTDLHRCRICQDYTPGEICKICASTKRDRSTICVVESPRDIQSIERTHEYNGLYHVLHGLISPMDGVGAEQLCIKELLARLDDTVKEVIMATSPTVEGEATAMYLAKLIKPLNRYTYSGLWPAGGRQPGIRRRGHIVPCHAGPRRNVSVRSSGIGSFRLTSRVAGGILIFHAVPIGCDKGR